MRVLFVSDIAIGAARLGSVALGSANRGAVYDDTTAAAQSR